MLMDGEEIYRNAQQEFQQSELDLKAEQERQRRLAENELLEGATTMREYNERRNALPHLVLQADAPPDEMSMADFLKWRDPKREYGWTHEMYLQAMRSRKA
jgi:hypothetical protein